MQCPFDAAKALRELMGEEVEVEQAPTGGGFGGKEDYPSLMAAWACLLSWKSGRDVKLILDRMEDFAFSTKRHPARMRYRSRFDDTGRLRSLEVDLTIDGGAYATLSAEVLARAVLHCTGFYDIPHIRVRARAVATNTPPNTSFRGFGAPQAIFGIERHMDDIARVVGISPAELRARNLPDESTRTLTGVPVPHAAALRRLFERARAESAFDEKYAAKSPGRGIGMALFMHGGGYLGNGETALASEGWLYLSEEGIAEIRVGSVEMGQGSMTALMQIVARELGVGLERIRYHRPDTARVADSGPTVASRTVMIVGGLLAEAARSLRRALEPYGGSEEFASAARAYLRAGGTAKFAAKYRPPALPVWDEERFRGRGYPDYSLGCYVAEVSVDPVDYRVRVERLYAANDVGEVVNPLMAEGQVEGGALQGIGYALSERLVREKGLLRNRTLSDYGTPMAPDAPREMTVRFLGEERPSCGLGELPMNGPAPAVVNAICHALGREFDAIPVTPEVIEEVSDVD
jgi:CO/xanthine dehydrogenase Mo-binding subunit